MPLLQPPESVPPDVICADPAKGDAAGNVAPLSDVAVCPNESTLRKRMVVPTRTVVTSGA